VPSLFAFSAVATLQASVRVNDLLLFSIDGIDESEETESAAAGGVGGEGERKQAPSTAASASSASASSSGGAVSPLEKPAVRFINLTFLKKASPAVRNETAQTV
jgi:hypothetical protein